jgi:hypothetical protein
LHHLETSSDPVSGTFSSYMQSRIIPSVTHRRQNPLDSTSVSVPSNMTKHFSIFFLRLMGRLEQSYTTPHSSQAYRNNWRYHPNGFLHAAVLQGHNEAVHVVATRCQYWLHSSYKSSEPENAEKTLTQAEYPSFRLQLMWQFLGQTEQPISGTILDITCHLTGSLQYFIFLTILPRLITNQLVKGNLSLGIINYHVIKMYGETEV